ncbi:MAG TPA: efflux transporter outer membrane subunit [Sphingomonas sp.]|nr:efflux transporter outer membrane subunit [Sphingomonas sp.]
MKRAGKAGLIALGACLASGCTVGPNYRPPSAARLGAPDRFATPAPPGSTPPGAAELARWWGALGDPLLDRLVTQALAESPTVEAAGARLRQARAALRQARAGLFPTLSASGSAGRTELIGKGSNAAIGAKTSATSLDLGLDAAYEVDLFGGVRRSVEAARADAAGAEDDLRDTQRSLAAEVALDYIDARSAQERLAIARSNLKSQDETVRIVGWRVQAGLVSSLDLAQARAQREQTAATIPVLETSFTQSANALAVLTGRTPGAILILLTPPAPVPDANRVLGVDVPARVLARRPDVRAAERSLAAATARIGVQTAQLYPALNLSGSLGGNGSSVGDLTRFATGSLLASITAPIFEGGAIRARIDSARGAADEAFANYRAAVLTALSDVENAMTALANARARVLALTSATEDSRNALILADSQYRAGLIDFQTVLDAQRTLLASQDGLAVARADRATALVQLYKALGGGWQAAPMPADATPGAPALIERAADRASPLPPSPSASERP